LGFPAETAGILFDVDVNTMEVSSFIRVRVEQGLCTALVLGIASTTKEIFFCIQFPATLETLIVTNNQIATIWL
jgi:hypothetical protein